MSADGGGGEVYVRVCVAGEGETDGIHKRCLNVTFLINKQMQK